MLSVKIGLFVSLRRIRQTKKNSTVAGDALPTGASGKTNNFSSEKCFDVKVCAIIDSDLKITHRNSGLKMSDYSLFFLF